MLQNFTSRGCLFLKPIRTQLKRHNLSQQNPKTLSPGPNRVPGGCQCPSRGRMPVSICHCDAKVLAAVSHWVSTHSAPALFPVPPLAMRTPGFSRHLQAPRHSSKAAVSAAGKLPESSKQNFPDSFSCFLQTSLQHIYCCCLLGLWFCGASGCTAGLAF